MEQQTYDLILVGGAVVQLIALIVFFVMAYNVSKIAKSKASSEEGWKNIYRKEITLGRNDKALNALHEALWIRYKEFVSGMGNHQIRVENVKSMRDEYEPKLKELGAEWPERLV
ncbi:hypothetical protein [Roseivirga sp. UBA838]|uniref:hypothetical protein n=1 Tax=Roseivirga sp. UBA838 TaxID=1947393 RepID=UPI002580B52A|nr:hypothetical protein [Roseivirga sp. UBA838]|tara:strand:+ start:9608 stop:9949 length:342 start_codon:yes stop_codon:yes gene_type:complete